MFLSSLGTHVAHPLGDIIITIMSQMSLLDLHPIALKKEEAEASYH